MPTRPDFARNHGLSKRGNGSASQAVLQWIGTARRELDSVRTNLERAAGHVQTSQMGAGLMGQSRSEAMLRAAQAVREAGKCADEIQALALGRVSSSSASDDLAASAGQ